MLSSVLFILILLSIQYTPTYVYRLITMNVADVYDYKNFENHRIQGAEHTNTFISKPKEKYIESLFEELVTKTGFFEVTLSIHDFEGSMPPQFS